MQSSLTTVLPSALDYSSRLPVSVLVRSPSFNPRSFSWTSFRWHQKLIRPCPGFGTDGRGFTYGRSATRRGPFLIGPSPSRCRPSIGPLGGAGMLTCSPSATPFGLALGTG